MSGESKDNPGGHVTRVECALITGNLNKKLDKVLDALIGTDMRSGLVQEVAALKKDKSTAVEIAKALIIPIIVALVTVWFVTGMPH